MKRLRLSRLHALAFVSAFNLLAIAADATAAGIAGAPHLSAMNIDQGAATGMTRPRKVAVFGDDDRVALPEHLRTLARSIGLVSSAGERTLCTGFCVGRRTVATAAHCLFRTAGERRPDLASFEFIVGARGQRKRSSLMGQGMRAQAQHVVAGSASVRVAPPIDATRDWALMRLQEPVCQGQELVVEPATPSQIDRLSARRRVLHVAFHGDRAAWQLAVSKSCTTTAGLEHGAMQQMARDFSDVSTLVLHECDTGLASSGSPLMALSGDNRLKVVAINVGTYQQTRYLVTDESVTRRFKPATVANTAISGSGFADHILAFTRADILTRRGDIERLQRALNARGFTAGPVDGIYGQQTRQGLVAFERATGRADIGLATRQRLSVIERYRR